MFLLMGQNDIYQSNKLNGTITKLQYTILIYLNYNLSMQKEGNPSILSYFINLIIVILFFKYVMAQENKNQLRLSLQIKSVKDHEFTAQLYFSIRPISALGMRLFKSSPSQAITNPRVETDIGNCFKSYLFQASRPQLKQMFDQSIYIELWHNDRIKKDILLGIAKLPLAQILQQPFRKSKQAYVLTFDVWLPIDEVDQSENSIKKIGALRTIAFLQDLGPISMLKNKGFDIKNFIDDEQIPIVDAKEQYMFNKNVLPSQKYGNSLDDQKRLQLNQLEHQVVWELETWKKAEQARTRLVLKQKQAEFWTSLSQQQKKSDIEKEKQFKKMEANLLLIQNKLKGKMNDLIKREQKIIVMEQQLQTKIGQISRQVFLKDEEIEKLKRKQKQEKTALIKQKSGVQLQLAKFRAENAKLKVELQEALKEDEKAPINILKNELTHKISQIKALRRELQNCMETKQQFKESYQKMKKEVIERGALLQQKNQLLSTANQQISLLKKDIKHLQQKLVLLKQQQFYANNYGYSHQQEEEGPIQFSSQKQRLIYKRREMLQAGNYTINDPLIKEIDKKIAALY